MPALILPAYFVDMTLGLFGALVGSFLNVVIARLPEGESIVHPRSHCPRCKASIPAWLNIPVLSWIMLRGRCRSCKLPISPRYPLVELLTALLFVAAGRRFGLSAPLLPSLMLIGALVAITFIDLDHFIIPDEISLPGILLALLLRPIVFDVPWYSGLLGAAVGAGALWSIRALFFLLRGVEGLGLGDVKLIAMIGGFLGPIALLPAILIASLSGSILGAIALVLQKDEPEEDEDVGVVEANEVGVVANAMNFAAPEAADDHEATDPNEVRPTATPMNFPALAPEPASEAEAQLTDPNEVHPTATPKNFAAPEATPDTAPDTTPQPTEDIPWTPPKNAIPFGPFLALGGLAMLLLGPEILLFIRRLGY